MVMRLQFSGVEWGPYTRGYKKNDFLLIFCTELTNEQYNDILFIFMFYRCVCKYF